MLFKNVEEVVLVYSLGVFFFLSRRIIMIRRNFLVIFMTTLMFIELYCFVLCCGSLSIFRIWVVIICITIQMAYLDRFD